MERKACKIKQHFEKDYPISNQKKKILEVY